MFECGTAREDAEFLNFTLKTAPTKVAFESGMVRNFVEGSPTSSTNSRKIGHSGSGDLAEILMKYLGKSSKEVSIDVD